MALAERGLKSLTALKLPESQHRSDDPLPQLLHERVVVFWSCRSREHAAVEAKARRGHSLLHEYVI